MTRDYTFFKSTWIKRLLCHRGFLAKKVLFAWQISVSPACWTTWRLDFCWNPYLLLIFVSWQESLLKMPMHLSTLKALCQKPQMATNKDLQLFCIPSEIFGSRSSGEMAQLYGTLMQNSRHRLMFVRFSKISLERAIVRHDTTCNTWNELYLYKWHRQSFWTTTRHKDNQHFAWNENLFWQAVCKSLVTSPGACKDRGLELGSQNSLASNKFSAARFQRDQVRCYMRPKIGYFIGWEPPGKWMISSLYTNHGFLLQRECSRALTEM